MKSQECLNSCIWSVLFCWEPSEAQYQLISLCFTTFTQVLLLFQPMKVFDAVVGFWTLVPSCFRKHKKRQTQNSRKHWSTVLVTKLESWSSNPSRNLTCLWSRTWTVAPRRVNSWRSVQSMQSWSKLCMFGFGWLNLNEAIASYLKCPSLVLREAKKAGKPIKVMNQELYGSILSGSLSFWRGKLISWWSPENMQGKCLFTPWMFIELILICRVNSSVEYWRIACH